MLSVYVLHWVKRITMGLLLCANNLYIFVSYRNVNFMVILLISKLFDVKTRHMQSFVYNVLCVLTGSVQRASHVSKLVAIQTTATPASTPSAGRSSPCSAS